jgi:hypothetical protein
MLSYIAYSQSKLIFFFRFVIMIDKLYQYYGHCGPKTECCSTHKTLGV